MGVIIKPNTIHFGLPITYGNSLKYKIYFIIKQVNIYLNIHQKTRLVSYCPNINLETIFMNTEKSKANKVYKFVVNLPQRLDLRTSNEMLVVKPYLFITREKI